LHLLVSLHSSISRRHVGLRGKSVAAHTNHSFISAVSFADSRVSMHVPFFVLKDLSFSCAPRQPPQRLPFIPLYGLDFGTFFLFHFYSFFLT
jgi:hypothetical protein